MNQQTRSDMEYSRRKKKTKREEFLEIIEKRAEAANDGRLSSIDCRINLRPGRFAKVSGKAIDWTRWIEKQKSSVRCKAEHIFRVIKCQFGYRKVRYRGLKKNKNRRYLRHVSL